MTIKKRFQREHTDVLRDIRPVGQRIADWLQETSNAAGVFVFGAVSFHIYPPLMTVADIIMLVYILFFIWLATRERTLAFKLPWGAPYKDKNNEGPGKNGEPEGILYIGNDKESGAECWFTNSDARTHILYLGTTGSGKTEGLKSMVTNAMCWGSGFVYTDGKADTDLWSSLSSLARRFGRDDDLLVLNYMTGNSDVKAPSNTMNPFASGSSSYLTQMLVSLMPEAEGDNAMWKERAVSLISSVMPALTWKRDNQDMPLSIATIRDYVTLGSVVKLARDEAIPDKITEGLQSYLETLPGFNDEAFDDNGNEKPMSPDQPMIDTTTPRQQHGYLAMQFTRALQSLGDEYGYIFDTQAADVDMLDIVLNRRILVVLIPALEKSNDEIANLGKIVAATLKGMMGQTLGATVEGDSSKVIENKPTYSQTPFITVFDEVGYYTVEGMAVMAAQARSLGFCLIYAAQDLPSLQKRAKEESRSITANCNIKIFGKLEDPTDTKDFFEKTVGEAIVMESTGFETQHGSMTKSYSDQAQASLQSRARASYDELRSFREGQAIIAFGEEVVEGKIFYANPGHAKAMRVTRYIALPPPDDTLMKHAATIAKLRDCMVKKNWRADKAEVAEETSDVIEAMMNAFDMAEQEGRDGTECGIAAIAGVHAIDNPVDLDAAGAPAEQPTAQKAPAQEKKPDGARKQGSRERVAPDKQDATESGDGGVQQKEEARQPAKAETTLEQQPNDSGADNPMAFFKGGSQQNQGATKQTTQQPAAEEKKQAEPHAQESVSSDTGAVRAKTKDYSQLAGDTKQDSPSFEALRKAASHTSRKLIRNTGGEAAE
jgi:intracellular multiplication protein IcmO